MHRALKLSDQRRHQQVGFGWKVSVERAHSDTDPLGNCPHVDRVVAAGGSNSERGIHNASRRRAERVNAAR